MQPLERGRHLADRLAHLGVIRNGSPAGSRASRLDEHALGRWCRHVQLMQEPLTLPGLARVKLRQALRSQQLPRQEGGTDKAEPADDGSLCVRRAPEGNPLDNGPVAAPLRSNPSPP
jgi:hypothetical protein